MKPNASFKKQKREGKRPAGNTSIKIKRIKVMVETLKR
jgi:hypothetical protein